MRKNKTQKMVGTAMIAAIGYVLMFFEFPILGAFPFLKVDFSDVPILLGAYLFGPGAAIIAALLRSVLHFVTLGGDVGRLIGDVTSFVSAVVFVLPVYYITQMKHTKKQLALGLVAGTLSLTIIMSVLNYFVILPLYLAVMNYSVGMAYGRYIMAAVIPFNLIKGILVSVVFALVHSKILPWLMTKRHFIPQDFKK